MSLELLHEIFFIQLWLEFVTGQWIVPVRLSFGQYLQSFLLQKEKPRSLLWLPNRTGFGTGNAGKGGAEEVLGFGGASRRAFLKKSLIDLCIDPWVWAVLVVSVLVRS